MKHVVVFTYPEQVTTMTHIEISREWDENVVEEYKMVKPGIMYQVVDSKRFEVYSSPHYELCLSWMINKAIIIEERNSNE